MARTLYLDCFSGISGDMFIGAMLDLGLDFDHLKGEILRLGVGGFELTIDRVDRSGIAATKFDVALAHDHHHHHHDHDHHHDHHHHHRSLSEIKRIIGQSGLSSAVKERSLDIFQRIGEAESRIHNIPIETVHFHEVGAIDSIVDIVGAGIALEALRVERVICSPIHVGSGSFTCAHGRYPVPGPATAELLRGVPSYSKEIEGELTTPTGAAIAASLTADFRSMPLMRIERVGYGAGTRDLPKFPNVLRAILGEVAADADATPETVTVIEATIDDLSGEVFGHLMARALDAGALEIFYIPVQMKKNRPGVLLTLLCRNSDRDRMAHLIFTETTTVGIRYREESRRILIRRKEVVNTPYGPITVKVSSDTDGTIINRHPEFEECRRAAEAHDVALRVVQQAALLG